LVNNIDNHHIEHFQAQVLEIIDLVSGRDKVEVIKSSEITGFARTNNGHGQHYRLLTKTKIINNDKTNSKEVEYIENHFMYDKERDRWIIDYNSVIKKMKSDNDFTPKAFKDYFELMIAHMNSIIPTITLNVKDRLIVPTDIEINYTDTVFRRLYNEMENNDEIHYPVFKFIKNFEDIQDKLTDNIRDDDNNLHITGGNGFVKEMTKKRKLIPDYKNKLQITFSNKSSIDVQQLTFRGLISTVFNEPNGIQVSFREKYYDIPEMVNLIKYIYVYTDFIKQQYFGDSYLPLIKSVLIDDAMANNNLINIYNNPDYVEVNKSIINTIKIEIKDTAGDYIKFNDIYSPVLIKLHFRPKQ